MRFDCDPAEGDAFWRSIERLPGYPHAETIRLRTMVFEADAIARLSSILTDVGARADRPVLLVVDPTPMRRGEDDLKLQVAQRLRAGGLEVEVCVAATDSDGQVHTDMEHIDAVRQRIRAGTAIVSLGSGTITDIAKHAAQLFEQSSGTSIPYVAVATANSVSAYTSNMAPTRINGVKRTLPSRYPDAVVCDLQVLRDAPYTMTAAGVGDLLAAFVSLPDWWLAYRLGMDATYSQLPGRLMGSLEHGLMADAPEIATRSMEGMRSLAKWIALAGLSMSLAHATSPMSGFEHVVSHLLDLQAEQRGEPLAMHGSQVGLDSIHGLAAYRSLTGDFDPRGLPLSSVFPKEALARAQVLQAFDQVDPSGRAGEECWSDYRIKLEAWHAQRERVAEVLGDWQGVRSELGTQLRPAARLREILRAVAAPLTFAALHPPARSEAVRFAFENAPFMRRRLTVADLLVFFHVDRERIWERAWGEVGG